MAHVKMYTTAIKDQYSKRCLNKRQLDSMDRGRKRPESSRPAMMEVGKITSDNGD
jgi:hypothetical protein